MLTLATGDAEHEEANATKHGQDDYQQKEDRPTRGIATAFDHRDAASRTSNKQWRKIHDRRYRFSEIAAARFAEKINTIDRHQQHTDDSGNTHRHGQCRFFRGD